MPTIATYCRVSTDDQHLDRQRQATADYALKTFDADLADLAAFEDKSTSTNTRRDGYRAMMELDDGEVEAIVANSVSRIARSIRDLDRIADPELRSSGGLFAGVKNSAILIVELRNPSLSFICELSDLASTAGFHPVVGSEKWIQASINE